MKILGALIQVKKKLNISGEAKNYSPSFNKLATEDSLQRK
jgi:hypothetical protein